MAGAPGAGAYYAPQYPPSAYPMAPYPYGAAAYAPGGASGKEAEEANLAYSKQPRAVEYEPYTMEEFKSKPYNAKQQKYWELGKIGPDLETDELREKREKAERMKQYAKDAHRKNMTSKATKPNKVQPVPLPSGPTWGCPSPSRKAPTASAGD